MTLCRCALLNGGQIGSLPSAEHVRRNGQLGGMRQPGIKPTTRLPLLHALSVLSSTAVARWPRNRDARLGVVTFKVTTPNRTGLGVKRRPSHPPRPNAPKRTAKARALRWAWSCAQATSSAASCMCGTLAPPPVSRSAYCVQVEGNAATSWVSMTARGRRSERN